MGSSSDGSTTAPVSPGVNVDDGEEQPQRGFFGRILDAFSPPEQDAGPEGDAAVLATQPAPMALPGIGNLRKLRVDDVAIPTAGIVAVPLDIGRDELVAVFRAHGFSRLPVYKGSLDHPQGLILLKDFALQQGFGASSKFDLTALLRPVLYAPPSMPLSVLLQKMQRDRVHMALVIDEYGGVDGLVTIEDLIETVIGEIDDEHDEAESAQWKLEKPGVYLVQGSAPLDEFETAIGLRLRMDDDDEDIDTIGGLVFLRNGSVPARGDIVKHESGAEFEVLEADPRRIKRLRVHLPSPAGPLKADDRATADT